MGKIKQSPPPRLRTRIDELTVVCQGTHRITRLTKKGSNRFDHERLGHPVFSAASTSASSPNHFRPVSHLLSPSYEPRLQNNFNSSLTQSSDSQYSNPISNPSSTAANGLFLLLQAHEELMKREKAQRAGQSDGGNNGRFELSLTRKQAYRWNGKEYTQAGRCL